MPRKRSNDAMAAQGGGPANPPRQRQRKKKEPVNNFDIKPEANMGYDMQGMQNGMPMMPDDGGHYGQPPMPPEYYYQQGGPTPTPSGSMNNGFGPPSLSHGPPGSAQPMSYQEMDPSQQMPQQMPPPYMHPMNPPPPQPTMMPPQQGPPGMGGMPGGPGPMNPPQSAGVPPQMMLRPPIPMSHLPQPPLLEYRILEMNKRMYSFYHQQCQVAPEHYAQWWEAFNQEFFDEDSRLTLVTFESLEMPKRYTIGRKLIGKFFRTLFETGIRELTFLPRSPSVEHISQWGTYSLDCENLVMYSLITKPVPANVVTDGRMFVEFSPYDEAYGYRIKNFTLELKQSQEYILKQYQTDMESQERIRHGITKCGIPAKAINFLKLCIIMEPMQHIMNYCKQNPSAMPRDALKNILFHAHAQRKTPATMTPLMPPMPPTGHVPQSNVMPPQTPMEEPAKKAPRKRQRKATNANPAASGATTPAKQRKANSRASPSQNPTGFPMNQNQYNVQQYQEVLVVGEPSLMGGDFGEEDERSISRIENTQYDASMMSHGPGSGMPPSAMNTPMSVGMGANNSTPSYSRQNSFNRSIDGQKMPPPQAAPLVHTPSSSNMQMMPPFPPPYDVSVMNNGWKNIPNPNSMNPPLMAQTICEQ